jgi:excisionase family DNA binding protein
MSTDQHTTPLLADIDDIVPEIGSRSKVYELIGQGEIKAVKIGTRTKIVLASFHDYVARLPAAQISPPRKRSKAAVRE